MIFYFTGTGNSLQIARNIADNQGEELVSIAARMKGKQEHYKFTLKQNEIIGFVYPIYAWNPPKMVLNFIAKLKFENYNGNYVFSAVTCGDNIGNTIKTIEAALNKAGMPLDSGFSVQMPNNYVIGFEVDPKDMEERKLLAAETTLKDINRSIANRETGIFKVEKGPVPAILSSVINPLFNHFAIRPRKFYAKENCTGCGICEKVSNCNNIKLEGPDVKKECRPVWGKDCTQCMACIHYCPVKAIQYGKGTEKKGRYTNPNVSIKEISRHE